MCRINARSAILMPAQVELLPMFCNLIWIKLPWLLLKTTETTLYCTVIYSYTALVTQLVVTLILLLTQLPLPTYVIILALNYTL